MTRKHSSLPVFTALAAGFALGGALISPLAVSHAINGDTPPEGRWKPCFERPETAEIAANFKKWDATMREMGQDPGPLENFVVIPEGTYAGEWIMPGCVAFETAWDGVSYWYDSKNMQARWVPYVDPTP